MNRKLWIRIPTISAKHTFHQHSAEKYKSIDAKIKEKRNINFDKRYRAKERSSFVEQLVWIKTPKTSPAKVAKISSRERSSLVKTDSGLIRRN